MPQVASSSRDGWAADAAPPVLVHTESGPEAMSKRGNLSESFGWSMLRLAEVESTNAALLALGRNGASAPMALFADHQTAGRGKGQRRWITRPYRGLNLSLLLKPERPIAEMAQLTLVIAVAVTSAVRRIADIPATIKWPNDILVHGRKLCGILCELEQTPEGDVAHVVAGIGLNVNMAASDFPESLRERATSLLIESGSPFDRMAVLAAIVKDVERWIALWETNGFAPVRAAWMAHSCTLGRSVEVKSTGESWCGVAVDLDAEGRLCVRDESGATQTFVFGETHIQPPNSRGAPTCK